MVLVDAGMVGRGCLLTSRVETPVPAVARRQEPQVPLTVIEELDGLNGPDRRGGPTGA